MFYNDKWNGNIGILIAKTKNNKIQTTNCFSFDRSWNIKTEKQVDCNSKYKIKRAKNKKTDPNKVYKKKYESALIRRSLLPQEIIIKNCKRQK